MGGDTIIGNRKTIMKKPIDGSLVDLLFIQ